MILMVLGPGAAAQEKIQIPSLDTDASGHPVLLDAYLFKPALATAAGPLPAVVFMHGCSGLITHSGKLMSREFDWAQRLNQQGYVVLAVDSFSTRGAASECAHGGAVTPQVERPRDAYGALRFLQSQPYVKPDRIALMGWSHGGGTVLFSIGPRSPAREINRGSMQISAPASPPRAASEVISAATTEATTEATPAASDFRTAIAFYPGWCNTSAQHASDWSTAIPLLILQGGSDTWTRAQPCEDFVQAVRANNMPVEIHLYPGAYHDFDFPHLPLTEHPEFAKRTGPVPITGTDPVARADAIERVTAYLAQALKP